MQTFGIIESSSQRHRLLIPIVLAIFIATAAASAVQAQDDNSRPFTKPGENSATITGLLGREAQYIYPVEFIEIDGNNIPPREVMWLKPGEYELTVRAVITDPPGLRSRSRFRTPDGNNRIQVVVEAGKEYSIGVKYDNSEPRNPFNTVLWRVRDN